MSRTQRKTDASKRRVEFKEEKLESSSNVKNKKKSTKSQVISLLRQLLEEYKNRIKDERNDLDITFKREFLQDLKDILQTYADKFYESEIDFDSVIKEALNAGTRVELIKQTEEIIKSAIKSLTQIKVSTKKKVSLEDILKGQDLSSKLKINNKNVKNIIQDLFEGGSNIQINSFKTKLQDISIKHTKRIIKVYESFFNQILPKVMKEDEKKNTKQNSSFKSNNRVVPNIINRKKNTKQNSSFKLKNMIPSVFKGNLDTLSKQKGHNLVKILYTWISYGVMQQCVKAVSQSFTKFYNMTKKIFKVISNFTVGIIGNVIKLIGKFVITPIYKAISVPFKLIFGISKKIVSNLTNVIKNLKIGYFFMTPAGAYALGWICGFIWEKIKQLMSKTDNGTGLFDKIYEKIGQGMQTALNWLEKKFPKTMAVLKWIFSIFKIVINPLMELVKKIFKGDFKGLGESFKNMTENIFEILDKSPIIKIVKSLCNIAIEMVKFSVNHPLLTGSIIAIFKAVKKLVNNYGALKKIASSGKAIMNAAQISKVGFFGAIGGMIGGYASSAVVEASYNAIFQSRSKDGQLKLRKSMEGINEVLDKINPIKFETMDNESMSRIVGLQEKVKSEMAQIRNYDSQIQDVMEVVNGDDDKMSIVHDFNMLIQDILNLPYVSREQKRTVKKAISANDNQGILRGLQDILRNRVEQMTNIINTLNIKGKEDLVLRKRKVKKDDGTEVEEYYNETIEALEKMYNGRQDYDKNMIIEKTSIIKKDIKSDGMNVKVTGETGNKYLMDNFTAKELSRASNVQNAGQYTYLMDKNVDTQKLNENRIQDILNYANKNKFLDLEGKTDKEKNELIQRIVYQGNRQQLKNMLEAMETQDNKSVELMFKNIEKDIGEQDNSPQTLLDKVMQQNIEKEKKSTEEAYNEYKKIRDSYKNKLENNQEYKNKVSEIEKKYKEKLDLSIEKAKESYKNLYEQKVTK